MKIVFETAYRIIKVFAVLIALATAGVAHAGPTPEQVKALVDALSGSNGDSDSGSEQQQVENSIIQSRQKMIDSKKCMNECISQFMQSGARPGTRCGQDSTCSSCLSTCNSN